MVSIVSTISRSRPEFHTHLHDLDGVMRLVHVAFLQAHACLHERQCTVAQRKYRCLVDVRLEEFGCLSLFVEEKQLESLAHLVRSQTKTYQIPMGEDKEIERRFSLWEER